MSNEEFVFGESVSALEEQKVKLLKQLSQIKEVIDIFEGNKICLEEMEQRDLGTEHARLYIYVKEAFKTVNSIKWALT